MCFPLRGEYVNKDLGLSLQRVSLSKNLLEIKLYTTTKYADGFKEIAIQPGNRMKTVPVADVKMHKSLLGATYYSANIRIPLDGKAEKVILKTVRIFPSYRYEPAIRNNIIIELNPDNGNIKNVAFRESTGEGEYTDRKLSDPVEIITRAGPENTLFYDT